MRLLLILIPIILLLSCAISEKERKYIDEISKLEHMLDSSANRYYAIDTTQLFKAYERINNNLSRLNQLDTLVNDSVKTYAAMQKMFKRHIREHALIMDEIGYSKNQLQTLKKDIRNSKIMLEQMENYYHVEEEAVGFLIHKLNFNAQNISYQLASFSELNDSVEMIIKRLESSTK